MMITKNTGREKLSPMSEAIGQSEIFIEFREQISKVAPIDRPVLILGERGTGKELAASSLHFLSGRWQKPLVTLNCSALTQGLIESELFGYEKGAFTGAAGQRAGRFEKAADGTLFLDEIGTIPMEVQEKILRVVEYGSFERVGSSEAIYVDVRIVAATNADLKSMADSGHFKQDLLDRLSFEVIYVPPLRKRKEDILLLADHFAGRMAYELGWEDSPEITDKAAKALKNYSWPGNIRELKNVIERAVYKSRDYKINEISFNPFVCPFADDPIAADPVAEEPITNDSKIKNTQADTKQISDLSEELYETKENTKDIEDAVSAAGRKTFKEAVAEFEMTLLRKALDECRFNQKAAAKKLGLSYHQLRGLLKKYNRT